MSKYDDFNLDLNKVAGAENKASSLLSGDIGCEIVKTAVKISVKVCDKTTKGKGCHPSYTKIGPCNRTLR